MFAKHLPPSPGPPRVLALDDRAAADLPPEVVVEKFNLAPAPAAARADLPSPGAFDAIIGYTAPEQLAALSAYLRPGGRLILAHPTHPQLLITALTAAGLIHCLVEETDGLTLYRGERPPLGSPLERTQLLADSPLPAGEGAGVRGSTSPFLFLLITQTPHLPAWKLTPGEKLAWQAATALDPATGQPALLAFTSLVKAVGFMQPAILQGWLTGVNKIGKFRAAVAATWAHPLILNPDFAVTRGLPLGPHSPVDPATAITGDE